MLDQPVHLMYCINAALATYDAVASWARMFYGHGNADRWLRTHGQHWELTQKWMELSNGI